MNINEFENYLMHNGCKIYSMAAIFNGCNKVKNVCINDFWSDDFPNSLKSYNKFNLYEKVTAKYERESRQIKTFVDAIDTIETRIHGNLYNIFVESSMLIRRAEAALKLSCRNKETPNDDFNGCIKALKEFKLEEIFETEISTLFPNKKFVPLTEDGFVETSRLNFSEIGNISELKINIDLDVIVGWETTRETIRVYRCLNKWCSERAARNLDEFLDDAGRQILGYKDYDIIEKAPNLDWISNPSCICESLSCIKPFVIFGSAYYTNPTLFSRFVVNKAHKILENDKRFQIKSGFCFENNVKSFLPNIGAVDLDVKRINRKEFDVVFLLNKIIYNVQCKNFQNGCYEYGEPEKSLNKFNRIYKRLRKALDKEICRERILENNMIDRGVVYNEIKHIVLSKFPIPSDSEIMDWQYFKTYFVKMNANKRSTDDR